MGGRKDAKRAKATQRNMFAVVKTLIEFEGESIFLHIMT